MPGKSIPGTGSSMCKGPEVRRSSAYMHGVSRGHACRCSPSPGRIARRQTCSQPARAGPQRLPGPPDRHPHWQTWGTHSHAWTSSFLFPENFLQDAGEGPLKMGGELGQRQGRPAVPGRLRTLLPRARAVTVLILERSQPRVALHAVPCGPLCQPP